jgi:peptide/nickel transport system substrate-binding protein
MRIGPAIVASTLPALLLVGCGGDDGGAASNDGTFTTSISADPGNLHPHLTVLSVARQVDGYMYDKLVYFTRDGEQLPWLAESWKVQPKSVTFTLKDGITCSDGSPLSASDVAANFDFVTDPKNASPINGVLIPPDLKASADDQAGTVTVSVSQPDPFLLQEAGELYIVCQGGLDNPDRLKSDGLGTGMYELTEAVPADHYTFQRRDGYTWGPGGVTSSDSGTPKTATLQVIENEATAVNLFLAGDLDAVTVEGPDRQRLEGQYEEEDVKSTAGELFYNQDEGRPGADPAVRAALSQSLDFSELMTVITGGFGEMSRMAATIEPTGCDYDAVGPHLEEPDPDAAAATLDAAGWVEGSDGVRSKDGQQLSVNLIYDASASDTVAAAAERITQQWSDIGVDASAKGLTPTEFNQVLFGTGDWDASITPVNVSLPSQLAQFFSGPTPPGGVNFAYIDNPDYRAAVRAALATPGRASCTKWQQAEEALYAQHDVNLFADTTTPVFLNGITLDLGSDGIVPATIRAAS